ncbi:YbgC/FadM family acyl-CoA thioesterase [Amylibacter sp.]|nr:YbgC/FadM family acyl-CoA thioesterase [Amylibacter sp.]MDB4248132.1 YbgC/FadM family acyl-CoA thioesterase [Amylibacter sp.]
MIHNFNLRIYYEDTDLAGIVYYANYLKFIERGRSSLIRELKIDQGTLKDLGFMFVVKKISAEYYASAKLDDELKVETKLSELSGAKILFDQSVYKGTILLFSSLVTVVFISEKGRPVRMPIEIAEKLKQFAA